MLAGIESLRPVIPQADLPQSGLKQKARR